MKIIYNKRNVNSFLYACFISQIIICDMITRFIFIPNISIIWMFLITTFFLINNGSVSKKNFETIIVIGLGFIGMFGVSIVFNDEYAAKYLPYFLIFGITAFVFNSTKNFDVRKIFFSLRYIFFAYIIIYILSYRSYFLNSDNYISLQMQVSYNLLMIIIAEFINMFVLKQEKTYLLLISIFNFILATVFMIVDCQTRGSIGCFFVFILLFYLLKNRGWKRSIFIISLIVLILLLMPFVSDILFTIHAFFQSHGIYLGFLDKTIWYMKNNAGQYDAGRMKMYVDAFELIKKSPVIGNGIGSYEKVYQVIYVHQYFLQILCEFGLVGLFLIILVLYESIMYLYNKKRALYDDNKMLMFFLFALCMPRLMFSNTYWMTNSYWLFFSLGVYNMRNKIVIKQR